MEFDYDAIVIGSGVIGAAINFELSKKENKEIRKERITPLVEWVNSCFPEINTDNFITWAGLRPMTSDMVPIMKESKRKN